MASCAEKNSSNVSSFDDGLCAFVSLFPAAGIEHFNEIKASINTISGRHSRLLLLPPTPPTTPSPSSGLSDNFSAIEVSASISPSFPMVDVAVLISHPSIKIPGTVSFSSPFPLRFTGSTTTCSPSSGDFMLSLSLSLSFSWVAFFNWVALYLESTSSCAMCRKR